MILAGRTHPSAAACFVEINDAVQALTWRPVLFNAHNCDNPPPGIIYNMESIPDQVDPARWAGRECWDSIASNVAKYPAGMKVTHVPVGYHRSMERFERAKVLDIDVVFCGALNGRRKRILDALTERGLEVAYIPPDPGNHGKVRDDVLSRAKLALNILWHDEAPFPALRCAHLVANRVPVLSEQCDDGWRFVRSASCGDLVEEAVAMLEEGAETLSSAANRRYGAFRSMPMVLP